MGMSVVEWALMIIILNGSCGIFAEMGFLPSSSSDNLAGKISEDTISGALGGNVSSYAYDTSTYDQNKYMDDSVKGFLSLLWNTTFGLIGPV